MVEKGIASDKEEQVGHIIRSGFATKDDLTHISKNSKNEYLRMQASKHLEL